MIPFCRLAHCREINSALAGRKVELTAMLNLSTQAGKNPIKVWEWRRRRVSREKITR
jgi:hypothetical protein